MHTSVAKLAGRAGGLSLFCAALALAPAAAQERPPGVNDSVISAGRALYLGAGQCVRCHGERGEGTAEGESLIAGQWKLGSGSYDWLVHITRHADIGARGREGDPAPMRGPTNLKPDEVKAVAAYVWSISRGRRPAGTD